MGVLVVLIGLGSLRLHGQSQPSAPQRPPESAVEVNDVEIDARVADAQGAFVIPLSAFSSGRCVLRVAARALLASGGIAARDVEIRIR